MSTGIVKWFNNTKGFGFITPDDGTEELFVHYSEVNVPGFKSLQEQQRVRYDVNSTPRGKQAVGVTPL